MWFVWYWLQTELMVLEGRSLNRGNRCNQCNRIEQRRVEVSPLNTEEGNVQLGTTNEPPLINQRIEIFLNFASAKIRPVCYNISWLNLKLCPMWCGTYLNGPSTSGPPLNNKYSNTFVVLYANSYNTTYHKRLGIIIALIYGLIKKIT